jgi:hypothetical protein
MNRFDRPLLKYYLQNFEDRLLRPDLRKIIFEADIMYNEECIFRFQNSGNVLYILPSNSLALDITEVADKSGIYGLQVEFSPSSKFKTHNGINTRSEYDVTTKTMQPKFPQWFIDACSSLGNRIYLIPDTNFVRRLYYSNYLTGIVSGRSGMSMMIPRLGIIEIESKYNRNKPKPNSSPDKELNRSKERRISFQTIGEILSIKNSGGGILPLTDMSLLQSFVPVSGQGYADAWIRREIASASPLVQVKPNEMQQSNIVFLTCDLMNALAAVAEDLNTMYFYRSEKDTIGLGPDPYEVFAKLIINTAIHFGECILSLKGDTKQEKSKVVGTWKGKSVDDWYKNFVLMDPI